MNTISTPEKAEKALDISVLVPVIEENDDLEEIFVEHCPILENNKLSYEFIFVLDGSFPSAEKKLDKLQAENPGVIKVIKYNRSFGEAKALTAAFNESTGERILTLAAYIQIVPEDIQKLFDNFTDDVDLVFGARHPRKDGILVRMQSSIFHSLVNGLTKERFHDIASGTRLLRRSVLEKIELYGDLFRFIPILAIYHGFNVKEIALKQARRASGFKIYNPIAYMRRFLDVLTLIFLIKFTQKPLRFFGSWGIGIGTVGFILTGITVVQRFLVDIGLSERPLFLVGILLILLGVQTFFIGLVAEIILFMHKPLEPFYNIEEKID